MLYFDFGMGFVTFGLVVVLVIGWAVDLRVGCVFGFGYRLFISVITLKCLFDVVVVL